MYIYYKNRNINNPLTLDELNELYFSSKKSSTDFTLCIGAMSIGCALMLAGFCLSEGVGTPGFRGVALAFSAISAGIISTLSYKQYNDVSTVELTTTEAENLSTWSALYPEVKKYEADVSNLNRPMTHSDFMFIKECVRQNTKDRWSSLGLLMLAVSCLIVSNIILVSVAVAHTIFAPFFK